MMMMTMMIKMVIMMIFRLEMKATFQNIMTTLVLADIHDSRE